MKKIIILFLVLSATIYVQKQEITLEDIWTKGPFNPQSLETFHSMNQGDFYTILNHNRQQTSLEKYDFATLEKVATILSVNELEGINYFDDYTLRKNETKFMEQSIGESKNKELEIIN